MAIELQNQGRRCYLIGNTYPIKDKIKAAGGHWDNDRKAWWIGVGKRAEFESLEATASNGSNGNGLLPYGLIRDHRAS